MKAGFSLDFEESPWRLVEIAKTRYNPTLAWHAFTKTHYHLLISRNSDNGFKFYTVKKLKEWVAENS